MSPISKLAITMAVLGLFAVGGVALARDDKTNLMAIVSTDEPQTQLMAMILTMQSVEQGAAARVLLCGPGGDLALRDAPASATEPQQPKGMSPQGAMKKLMARGVPVEVCALYLPNAGLEASALVDGVTAARPPEMARHLLAENVRLLNF